MKPFRRHPLYALCLAALCSTNASALGVGTARVLSPLGTPLKALIPIEHSDGLSADEIKAGLASEADYRRMDVERDWAQRGLQFRTVFRDGKPYIEVTTHKPVVEPYVDFVLSLRWPNGAIAREYALLLDPAGSSTAAVPPAQTTTAVAPSRPATGDSPPAPHSRPAPIATGSRYTTRRGDSLWQIAERVRGGHTIGATMDAIYRANPRAFINGDRNRLKAGTTIRVPESTVLAASSTTTAGAGRAGQSNSSAEAAQTTPPAARTDAGAATPARAANGEARQSAQELAGLQQGINQVSATQAATRAKVAALESELNDMITRYKALAAKTGALQSQLDRARQAAPPSIPAHPAPAITAGNSTVGSSTPWWVHAIYLGIIGALGAWLGRERLAALRRRVAPNRSARPTAAAATATTAGYEDLDDDFIPPAVPMSSEAQDSVFDQDQDQALDPALIAGAHIAFGQLEEARSVLEEAITARPDDSALQLQLLDVYAQAGKRDAFEQLAAQLDGGDLDPSERREVDYLRSRLDGDEPANVTNLDAKRRKSTG